ncbi:MAG: hypothetical protein V4543_02065 [Bacteroidota bacterium]
MNILKLQFTLALLAYLLIYNLTLMLVVVTSLFLLLEGLSSGMYVPQEMKTGMPLIVSVALVDAFSLGLVLRLRKFRPFTYRSFNYPDGHILKHRTAKRILWQSLVVFSLLCLGASAFWGLLIAGSSHMTLERSPQPLIVFISTSAMFLSIFQYAQAKIKQIA